MYSPGHSAQRQDRTCSEGCVIIDPFRCLRPRFLNPFYDIWNIKLTIRPTVAITLTPLNSSEASEARSIYLNKEKRHVDVGRASRNPDRGAQPTSDNAVFRCPILSRLHARFIASSVEKVRKYSSSIISTGSANLVDRHSTSRILAQHMEPSLATKRSMRGQR